MTVYSRFYSLDVWIQLSNFRLLNQNSCLDSLKVPLNHFLYVDPNLLPEQGRDSRRTHGLSRSESSNPLRRKMSRENLVCPLYRENSLNLPRQSRLVTSHLLHKTSSDVLLLDWSFLWGSRGRFPQLLELRETLHMAVRELFDLLFYLSVP